MASPEGYTELGLVGYSDRGTYSATATYTKGNVVYYKGSSFVCLQENIINITPVSDDINWRYMAHGFEAQSTDETYVTLSADSWSESAPYSQTVAISSVSEADNPLVLINTTDASYTDGTESEQAVIEAEFNYIKSIVITDGSITVTCTFRKPSVDIPIILRGH